VNARRAIARDRRRGRRLPWPPGKNSTVALPGIVLSPRGFRTSTSRRATGDPPRDSVPVTTARVRSASPFMFSARNWQPNSAMSPPPASQRCSALCTYAIRRLPIPNTSGWPAACAASRSMCTSMNSSFTAA
jgi:hypothetical protein